ncbi:MAG: magnesium and cobalt transport protein CorA [Hydrogenophilaceae bacterium]|nr:magnesium and cobalt transport protein CorA [Hydrogenophilaceae bacterium]
MSHSSCMIYHQGKPPLEIPVVDVSEYIHDPTSFIWIELHDPDYAQLEQLGEELGLHDLALEDAITSHQRPKLEEYGDHLFISAKTAELWEGQLKMGEAHFFAGGNFITSIRHGSGLSFARVRDRLSHPNGTPVNAPFALYSVLDQITDHFQSVVNALQDRFRTLENVLLSDTLDRSELEKLYRVKQDLSLLRDAAEPMQAIVQDLIRLHPQFATKELKAYYRDVLDHATRVTSAIDVLRMSAADAMQFHLASLTLQQSESVQKLAGWGAILAIPTVIFSLYGMNFDLMPELHCPWAYPAVLAGTFAGSLWLYRRLKKRGWV